LVPAASWQRTAGLLVVLSCDSVAWKISELQNGSSLFLVSLRILMTLDDSFLCANSGRSGSSSHFWAGKMFPSSSAPGGTSGKPIQGVAECCMAM